MTKYSILAALVLFGVFAAIFVPRGAQATTNRQADLSSQVRTLAAQVKTLNAQVKKLKKQVASNTSEIYFNYEGDGCLAAITADALQGTWILHDRVAQPVLSTSYFGTPTAIDDLGACHNIRVARKQLQAPPNLDVFTKLMTWINP